MILGVTGSRFQRPQRLISKLAEFMQDNGVTKLHFGDCTGWDEQAFNVAALLGILTVSHPPEDEGFRAFCEADVILPSKPYLPRNKDIVNAINFLIAAPDGPERQRSGTWSTVRYAKKVGVKGVVWL